MHKSRRFFLMSLAVLTGLAGIGAFDLPAIAQSGDDFITMCFNNRTIQVPFYLRNRYVARGATDGPCPTSP
jgi:hypothetical protein